ncbi:hypothetical protein CRE_20081 [Caenorhabditis remanei]|uniref:Uncharacterized protein n=1 Tax=Caenorhabditis remanei TaxID=31234 RepID=E3NKE3_CAERE|nr:hypothetical protein CRE_20081 [Caenorhabditis remanei]
MDDSQPFPQCPSQQLATALVVSSNILNQPDELCSYAERVPLIRDDDLADLTDPMSRGNLLWYMRTGHLPHPSNFIREVTKREPYMANNRQLLDWIRSMIRGTYSKTRPVPGNRYATNRCSACGSSCMGTALEDHSENDCGFVRYLSNEEKLEFAVANGYAFCGYCNSRSASHTKCDMPRNCRKCHKQGHQHYHGVCNLELTPLQFQEMVRTIRIKRGRRIRWLVENGYLAFPLPNDYVPSAVLDGIRGRHIRGVGPLTSPAADEFGVIPEYAFRWMPYRGLRNRELEHLSLLDPVYLDDDQFDWFVLLEKRAREVYKTNRRSGKIPLIVKLTCYLPDPVFPDDIHALGKIQNQGARVVELPNNGELSIPRAHEEYETQANQANSAAVQSVLNYIHSNPPQVMDTDLKSKLIMEPPGDSFNEEFDRIVDEYQDLQLNAAMMEVGGIPPNAEQQMEEQLSNLVLRYIRYNVNCMPDDRHSFGVVPLVVNSFESLETPNSREAIIWRIQTWQLILTGQYDSEPVGADVSNDTITRYLRYLVDRGNSLVGSPRCYVRLAFEMIPADYREVFKVIPSIRLFTDPAMDLIVNRWMAAEPAGFAILNAPATQFPYSEELGGPVDEGISVEVERARELEVKEAIRTLDSSRPPHHYRARFPSLDVIDIMLVYPFPEHKSEVIHRIKTIQLTMTANCEHTERLNTCPHPRLKSYLEFWRAVLLAIRCLVENGASAPVRMSDCTVEMLHGGKTSLDLALPSMRVYRWETGDWWLIWIEKTLIPQLWKISGHVCRCTAGPDSTRPRDRQDEQGQ